jgi:hypothetical protein
MYPNMGFTKCSGTLPSWLCMFAKAILPNCQAYFAPPQVNVSRSIWPSRELHIAILPDCQIHIAQVGLWSLSTPLYQIARLTLPKLTYCQRHSGKLQGWHWPNWRLFSFVNVTLPYCNASYQQWRTSRQHCQVYIPKLPTTHCYFANLPSLVYHVELMPQTFAPENLTALVIFVFFTGNFGLCPSFLPFSLPSLWFHCFCDLMGLWSLQGALSKFKLPSKLLFEHIEIKLNFFDFKFHVFWKSTFVNDVDLKAS